MCSTLSGSFLHIAGFLITKSLQFNHIGLVFTALFFFGSFELKPTLTLKIPRNSMFGLSRHKLSKKYKNANFFFRNSQPLSGKNTVLESIKGTNKLIRFQSPRLWLLFKARKRKPRVHLNTSQILSLVILNFIKNSYTCLFVLTVSLTNQACTRNSQKSLGPLTN